jgi:RNA polymerase sigma factor FliA
VQSLEQTVTSRDESYEWEIEDDDASVQPETVVDRKVVAGLLARAMTTLKERDREIINMRYNQDMPFRLIGLKLHISESRVSQIHLRILNNLKKALEHTDIAAA